MSELANDSGVQFKTPRRPPCIYHGLCADDHASKHPRAPPSTTIEPLHPQPEHQTNLHPLPRSPNPSTPPHKHPPATSTMYTPPPHPSPPQPPQPLTPPPHRCTWTTQLLTTRNGRTTTKITVMVDCGKAYCFTSARFDRRRQQHPSSSSSSSRHSSSSGSRRSQSDGSSSRSGSSSERRRGGWKPWGF